MKTSDLRVAKKYIQLHQSAASRGIEFGLKWREVEAYMEAQS